MAQIINAPRPHEMLAEKFGTGLSSGLQSLLNMKMQDIKRKREQTGLEAMGLPGALAGLDPRIIQEALKIKTAGQQDSNLSNALSQIYGGQQGSETGGQVLPEKKQAPGEGTGAPAGVSFDQALANPNLTSNQKLKIIELRKKQEEGIEKKQEGLRKEKIEEQKRADSATGEVYKDVNKNYRDARENDLRLKRMSKLVKKGNLGSPLWYSLLDAVSGNNKFGIGINFKSLLTADSQEFDKLSTEFIKGAKALFGARITDNEIRMFLRMVPTLSQSEGGKNRVIRNMRVMGQAAKIRKGIMDKIISKNNGKRPMDLESLIERVADKKLDKLSKAFKKGLGGSKDSSEDLSAIGKGQQMLSPGLSLDLFGI